MEFVSRCGSSYFSHTISSKFKENSPLLPLSGSQSEVDPELELD